MRRPKFRIICCLCRKPIPQAADVHDLDEEWQRRFPDMIGTLACERCATERHEWKCHKRDGSYVDAHIRSVDQPESRDFDSWSHVGPPGTHVAMVMLNPWAGLLQGAEAYLRYTAKRPGVEPGVRQRLQAVLDQWDTQTSGRTYGRPG